MALKNTCIVSLALLLTFSSAINAVDISKTMGAHPEYATFNKYLTETKLADQITSAKAVTILVLDNAALSSLAGKSADAIKTTIGSQVIVGYYDEKKFMEAVGADTKLTTLATPIYSNLIGEGSIAFADNAAGGDGDSEIVKSVTSEPETLSIIQVTKPIVVAAGGASAASGASTTAAPATTATPSTPATTATPTATPAVTEEPRSAAVDATASAPAAAPSSSSSRTQIGFFGAAIAFASVFVSL